MRIDEVCRVGFSGVSRGVSRGACVLFNPCSYVR